MEALTLGPRPRVVARFVARLRGDCQARSPTLPSSLQVAPGVRNSSSERYVGTPPRPLRSGHLRQELSRSTMLCMMRNTDMSDNTILIRALDELRSRLPRTWGVEVIDRRAYVPGPDAVVRVVGPDDTASFLLIEVRSRLDPKDVEPLVSRLLCACGRTVRRPRSSWPDS